MSVAGRKASITRPHDADKFAAYKARKMAQKEEDRAKLAAAFPHLFDSEAYKIKIAKEKYAGMKAAGTPSKRKASIVDENHENTVPTNGIPAPNSAKKLRVVKPPANLSTTSRSSTNGSKSISAGQKNVALGSVSSAQSTTTAAANAPVLTSTRKPFLAMPSFSLSGKQSLSQQQSHQQLQTRKREEVEIEMESVKLVSTSSVTICAQVEAPVSQAEVAMEATEASTVDERPLHAADTALPTPAEPQLLEEQVKDVLEYMLETEEIDKKLFERLSRSSSSITATSVRRLSTARQSLCASVPVSSLLSSSTTATTATEEGTSSAVTSMDESSVDDVAVLDTVRTILTSLKEASSFNTLVSDTGEVVPEVEAEEIDVEAAIDAAVQDLVDQLPAETAAAVSVLVPQTPITPLATKTVSWSLQHESTATTASEAVSTQQPQSQLLATSVPMEASCTPSKLVRTPSRVQTHPRVLLLEEAMSRGLLTAEVLQSMTIGNHVKYLIDLRTLPYEGDASQCIRATLLKRYSEFRNFRSDLLSVLSDEQRVLIQELPPRDRGEAERGEEVVGCVQGLHNWLQNVLSLQASLHRQYRDRIYAFVSN